MALNLKLLEPTSCVDAAVLTCYDGKAPPNSMEGIRASDTGLARVRAWRLLASDADTPIATPWPARSKTCRHIERLMVLGLFAQLAGMVSAPFPPVAAGHIRGRR